MKCISIKGDWAIKIFTGEKTIETRTWKTKHRGLILLHASQRPKSNISGKVFAIAILDSCVPMEKEHEENACVEVYDNAWAWILKGIVPIIPFPMKGQLGLYNIKEPDIGLLSTILATNIGMKTVIDALNIEALEKVTEEFAQACHLQRQYIDDLTKFLTPIIDISKKGKEDLDV